MAEGKSSNETKGYSSAKRNGGPGNYNTYKHEFYNMNHKYRGKALIFNHEHFDINLPRCSGTNKDCANLDDCLKRLGFNVDVFHDLKYAEVMEQVTRTANMNHSKNDCLFVVVLTHGKFGLLYAKDTHYSFQKLWCRFTDQLCPTLAGKPKLFFFQACQGDGYDEGVTLNKDVETDGWFEPHKIPTHPDFLLALSTVPGFYSWRNTGRGSWFVQALCEELNYLATEADMDILTMLTLVCRNVALNFESSTDEVDSHQKKQVPCVSSMLTRRLVFTKKTDGSNNMNSFLKRFRDCTL